MSGFDEREKAFEQEFLHDRDLHFRIVARRNKLFGLWVAHRIGLWGDAAERYALSVVDSEIVGRGDEAVVQRLLRDLANAAVPATEQEVRAQLELFDEKARTEIIGKTSYGT